MDEITYLCDLALKFSEVNRTGVTLHNGQPESDTDHTVMLGWLACALACKWYAQLDVGLISQFALVHDAPEVYAGDVLSLGMSEEVATNKKLREEQAIKQLESEITLPWFVDTIKLYERQELPEARFVRALDKVLPKIVAYLNDYQWLIENRTWQALQAQLQAQLVDIKAYASEFTELINLYVHCAYRVIKGLYEKELLAVGVTFS